jgi:hypothetical protein
VFPYALYEKCIALGQKDNWSASDPACAAAMKALLSSELLPPLNAKILALLFGFLKKLATQPDYVACTRMNLANIGQPAAHAKSEGGQWDCFFLFLSSAYTFRG